MNAGWQFSLRGLIIASFAAAILSRLYERGGTPWLFFGMTVAGGVWVLWSGWRWARYGTTWWPRGLLGIVLAILLPAGIPVLIYVTFLAIGKANVPFFPVPWFPEWAFHSH